MWNSISKRTSSSPKARRRSVGGQLEMMQLEPRCMLASSLHVDFGFGFPNEVMYFTPADMVDPGVNGPDNLFHQPPGDVISLARTVRELNLDYNGDGTANQADAAILGNRVINELDRLFAPFDVSIVQASASSINDLKATLANSPTNDAYMFAAGYSLCCGSAPYDAGNLRDDTAFVWAGTLLRDYGGTLDNVASKIAGFVAHEAAHTYGLDHSSRWTLNTTNDVMRPFLSISGFQYNYLFHRYPFLIDTNEAPTESTPTQNSYDRLASNIGQKQGPAYITGTGAYDRISIESHEGALARVTVEPFSDENFTTSAGLPYSYLVDVTRGVEIHAGRASDQVSIRTNGMPTNTFFKVDGGEGNDTVHVQTPDNWNELATLDNSRLVLAAQATIEFNDLGETEHLRVVGTASSKIRVTQTSPSLSVELQDFGDVKLKGDRGDFPNAVSISNQPGAMSAVSVNLFSETATQDILVSSRGVSVFGSDSYDDLVFWAFDHADRIASIKYIGGSGRDYVSVYPVAAPVTVIGGALDRVAYVDEMSPARQTFRFISTGENELRMDSTSAGPLTVRGVGNFSLFAPFVGSHLVRVEELPANMTLEIMARSLDVVELGRLSRVNRLLGTISVSGSDNVRVVVDDSDGATARQIAIGPVAGTSAGEFTTGLVGNGLYTFLDSTSSLTIKGGKKHDWFTINKINALENISLDGGTGNYNDLDFSSISSNVYVNLNTGEATGIRGGITNFQYIAGGSGNDILVGNGGNFLWGNGGRDILIAGSSASILVGGQGQDLLIGGTTDYDTSRTALDNIMAEWSRTDINYATRAANLVNGTGVPRLNASTVHRNGGGNQIHGAGGLDLFFAETASEVFDRDPGSETLISL